MTNLNPAVISVLNNDELLNQHLDYFNFDRLEAINILVNNTMLTKEKAKNDREEVLAFIKSKGYGSLEEIGLAPKQMPLPSVEQTGRSKKADDTPSAPNLRLVKRENVYFRHLNGDNWELVVAPRLVKKLQDEKAVLKRIGDMNANDKLSDIAEKLYVNYQNETIRNYNERAVIWNAHAEVNNLEQKPIVSEVKVLSFDEEKPTADKVEDKNKK